MEECFIMLLEWIWQRFKVCSRKDLCIHYPVHVYRWAILLWFYDMVGCLHLQDNVYEQFIVSWQQLLSIYLYTKISGCYLMLSRWWTEKGKIRALGMGGQVDLWRLPAQNKASFVVSVCLFRADIDLFSNGFQTLAYNFTPCCYSSPIPFGSRYGSWYTNGCCLDNSTESVHLAKPAFRATSRRAFTVSTTTRMQGKATLDNNFGKSTDRLQYSQHQGGWSQLQIRQRCASRVWSISHLGYAQVYPAVQCL